MLVAGSRTFLEAGEVEERSCKVVAARALEPVDRRPPLRPVRHVVAEAELARADRVEHPAGPPLHPLGNHGRSTRAQCTSAGRGSSPAHIAST